MKHLALFTLSVAAMCAPSYGALFKGDITFTFNRISIGDDLGDRGLSVGDTFHGFYTYESPTVDGAFSRDEMEVGFFIPAAFKPFGLDNPIPMDGEVLEMTVSGGVVSAFEFGVTLFTLDFHFDLDSFFIANLHGPNDILGVGTVSVGVPHQVPEWGPTVFLLLIGMGSVLIFAKRNCWGAEPSE